MTLVVVSFTRENRPWLHVGGCARKIDDDGGHSSRTFSTRHRTGCILLTFGLRRRALENPSFARRRVRPSGRRLRRIFSVSSAPPPTTSLMLRSLRSQFSVFSTAPPSFGCTKTCLPRRRLPGAFPLILARGLSLSRSLLAQTIWWCHKIVDFPPRFAQENSKTCVVAPH